mmetsp:Transcript_71618/g.202435  ORF Transcript_71618/g.202435 Transcript_71618/m.202435 type:complete len:128 (-) Transcript_71618:749-1132(-)
MFKAVLVALALVGASAYTPSFGRSAVRMSADSSRREFAGKLAAGAAAMGAASAPANVSEGWIGFIERRAWEALRRGVSSMSEREIVDTRARGRRGQGGGGKEKCSTTALRAQRPALPVPDRDKTHHH